MYYFIVNPAARCGRGEKIWNKLEKILKRQQIAYESFLTTQAGDAGKYARSLTEGCKEPRVITAVGGDGTFSEVLDGISFCGPVTLGYIPAGSGNDLARSLHFPKNPKRCLRKILSPKYHKMLDYGIISYGDDIIHHRRFAVSSGIGLDAAVCHNLLYSKTKKWLNRFHAGKLAYLVIGIKQLLKAKSTKGYIILDGVKKVEFNHIYFISVHIHPFEGGGFRFAPRADYSDGKFSVCVVSSHSKSRLVPLLLSSYLKSHSRCKGIRYYECKEAQIHVDNPMAVHSDGESCFCQTDIQLSCVEKKVRLIV